MRVARAIALRALCALALAVTPVVANVRVHGDVRLDDADDGDGVRDRERDEHVVRRDDAGADVRGVHGGAVR